LNPATPCWFTGFGSEDEHAATVAAISAELPPAVEFRHPDAVRGVQQLFDEANRWGQYYYGRSSYLAGTPP